MWHKFLCLILGHKRRRKMMLADMGAVLICPRCLSQSSMKPVKPKQLRIAA